MEHQAPPSSHLLVLGQGEEERRPGANRREEAGHTIAMGRRASAGSQGQGRAGSKRAQSREESECLTLFYLLDFLCTPELEGRERERNKE